MFDIVSLIKKHIGIRLQSLETAQIVIVTGVDYETWTCSVRPKAKVNVRGNVQDYPIITGLPIAVQKAGDSVILMPIKAQDIGVVIFSKYAIDKLRIDRSTVDVQIPRNFALDDAIYIGGLFTGLETVPTIVEGEIIMYHKTGSYIKFDADGKLYIHAKKIYMTEAT